MVKTDSNGFKTVDYSRLTPVLLEAIKELQVQVETKGKLIEEQKVRMDKQGLQIEKQDSKIEMLIMEMEALKKKVQEKI